MEEETHRCEVKACPHMTFRSHYICIPKGNTMTLRKLEKILIISHLKQEKETFQLLWI